MHQYILNLVGLLDLDAYSRAIDAGLDEDTLILVSGDSEGVQEDFGTAGGFDLGHVVALGGL